MIRIQLHLNTNVREHIQLEYRVGIITILSYQKSALKKALAGITFFYLLRNENISILFHHGLTALPGFFVQLPRAPVHHFKTIYNT